MLLYLVTLAKLEINSSQRLVDNDVLYFCSTMDRDVTVAEDVRGLVNTSRPSQYTLFLQFVFYSSLPYTHRIRTCIGKPFEASV